MSAGRARVAFFVLALATVASAQDRDPAHDDPERGTIRRQPTETLREPQPPPSTYDPNDEAPPPGAPETPTAPKRPTAQPGGSTPEGGSALDAIQLKANARARFSLGWDSNVIRSHRRESDGFSHTFGEGQALITFPGERELFASVSGEWISCFKETEANELYASSFIDYYHPFSSIFDVDVQNTFEYSKQNILDDNGDNLLRSRFNALDEEARATLIVHAGSRLSFELSGGGRSKTFEDNGDPTVPSFSYWEVRGSGGVRYKLWPDGRLKVRYVFRERKYLEQVANDRVGTPTVGNPKLELQRHQLLMTFSQRAEIFGMRFVAQLGYTVTYNKDTFQNDRTYLEHAASAHLEWWPLPTWTVVDFDVRGGDRAFLVRRTLKRGDPRLGTRLEQSYCDITIGVWQRLMGPPTRSPDGDFTNTERGLCLALTAEASWFVYHSADVRPSYERFVVQAGVEASF